MGEPQPPSQGMYAANNVSMFVDPSHPVDTHAMSSVSAGHNPLIFMQEPAPRYFYVPYYPGMPMQAGNCIIPSANLQQMFGHEDAIGTQAHAAYIGGLSDAPHMGQMPYLNPSLVCMHPMSSNYPKDARRRAQGKFTYRGEMNPVPAPEDDDQVAWQGTYLKQIPDGRDDVTPEREKSRSAPNTKNSIVLPNGKNIPSPSGWLQGGPRRMITYACGYCGRQKRSRSAASDGMVRIRCGCGGFRGGGVPRMHSQWNEVKLKCDNNGSSEPQPEESIPEIHNQVGPAPKKRKYVCETNGEFKPQKLEGEVSYQRGPGLHAQPRYYEMMDGERQGNIKPQNVKRGADDANAVQSILSLRSQVQDSSVEN